MHTVTPSLRSRLPRPRAMVAAGAAILLAGAALSWSVQGQDAGPPKLQQAAAGMAPVKYRHKQVAMPMQPTLGKTDRPFVPDFETAFAGWEVVTAVSLVSAPWPMDVDVPADRRWRAIPNQKLPWVLYTLRQPVP